MSKSGEVDDRAAACRCPPDCARVEHIVAVGNVEADDFVTLISQVPGDYRADTSPLAGNENAHTDNDPRELGVAIRAVT
jgi:hypothetical protein